jgi:DNA-binding response OmpR family regulator
MAKVLVVDDDPAGLDLRKLVLERRGHHVTTAQNIEEARSAFLASAPETIILDLRLPGPEDGLTLIREFRAAAPGVRIVVLSGDSAALDGRPEAQMVDEVLVKPVRSERILEAIRGN